MAFAGMSSAGGGGAVTAINNATANELVTIGATTTEVDAEERLTFDGTTLRVGIDGTDDSGRIHLQGPGSDSNLLIQLDQTNNTGFYTDGGNGFFAVSNGQKVYFTGGNIRMGPKDIYFGGDTNSRVMSIRPENSNTEMAFYTGGNDAGDEQMRLLVGGQLGIGTTAASQNADLTLEGGHSGSEAGGALALKEFAAGTDDNTQRPTADTNYGKIYCKDDNKLYFQDGANTEHEIAFV